jgi:hypothetical protein
MDNTIIDFLFALVYFVLKFSCYFTTVNAEVVLKATNVDGVYDADPKHNPNASLLEAVSYHEVTSRDLSVLDMTAITLCQENNIPGMDGIGFGSFGCFSPCFEFVIWCITLCSCRVQLAKTWKYCKSHCR